MEIKKVSIIGIGAVGCIAAPKLIRILPREDVRIIAGGSRKERLENNGVEVNGEHVDLYVTDPEEDVKPADLLIVAVKYSGLKQAIADMKKHVGPDTIILSLMNGIAPREEIAAAYGEEKCIYGVTNQSVVNLGGGKFRVPEAPQGILFGEAENPALATDNATAAGHAAASAAACSGMVRSACSERIAAIADLFSRAGIGYRIPENMVHDSWWKFLMNVGGNSTNTVLRGTQSYFQKLSWANEARRMVMKEALQVAQAEGAPVTEADVDELMDIYRIFPGENTCSMLQDVMAHRPTENDLFCGYVIRKGKKHGIPTPVNEFLYDLIASLDEVNAGADVSIVDPMLQ